MAFDFPERLTALDEVPEHFRGLYEQDGDNFTYRPEFKTHLHGLTSALAKERKTRGDLDKKVQAWLALGESPETVQARLKELEEAGKKGAEGQTNWDKMRADLQAGHEREIAKLNDQVKRSQTTVARYLIDSEATTAITELKGRVALLLPHIKAQAKVLEEGDNFVVRILDADGEPRGNGKGGFMTVKDLVSEMRTSETFSCAFESTGTSGGGRPSNKQSNGAQTKTMSALDKISAGLKARS